MTPQITPNNQKIPNGAFMYLMNSLQTPNCTKNKQLFPLDKSECDYKILTNCSDVSNKMVFFTVLFRYKVSI